MKTKYANLIEQLELVTAAYNAALSAVLNLNEMVSEQSDVLGISGAVSYFGDDFEKRRAIHLDAKILTDAAIDCGSGFQCEDWDDLTQVECTLFGYRVVCLAAKGSAEEACLLDLAVAEEKSNE